MNTGHMGLYNDQIRNQQFERRLSQLISTDNCGPIVDVGDDSYLSILFSLKSSHANYAVYSFEPRELSRLRWKSVIELNHVNVALIAGQPSNPQIEEIFGKEGIRAVIWNCHNYQMEDHCVMEALSYWCIVNSMRSKIASYNYNKIPCQALYN